MVEADFSVKLCTQAEQYFIKMLSKGKLIISATAIGYYSTPKGFEWDQRGSNGVKQGYIDTSCHEYEHL